jgi:hypothetical protein
VKRRKRPTIHIVQQYIAGMPRTRCGIYGDPQHVTVLPQKATCKRCKEVK